MATVSRTITLGHRANTGVDVEQVELCEGDEVTVLREFRDTVLCQDTQGRLFNVPKDCVKPD